MVITKKRYKPQIRSRHPSHSILRRGLPTFPIRSLIRFGSTTSATINKGRIEINTVDAIKNSSNKKLMKTCFKTYNVKTALWYTIRNNRAFDEINNSIVDFGDLTFPIIAKRLFGSRGRGNTKLNTLGEFNIFISNSERNLNEYIFEKFYNYAREYRLHITEDGCFYTCRKLMKTTTPDENKWYKNNDNCIWALENNKNFDKPDNWATVVEESVKALKAVGLDFGAVDLRIQSGKGENKTNPDFIVVEINSAPSFGTVTGFKYKEMLIKLINKKIKK